MKNLALLAGSTFLALTLVACGGNGQKKADEQVQQPEVTQTVQPVEPEAKPAEPAAAPAAEEAAPAPAAGTEPAH